jgi:hypothetical protein
MVGIGVTVTDPSDILPGSAIPIFDGINYI